MALLADTLAQLGRQMLRVDDGGVDAGRGGTRLRHMQRAGAMTALAADRVPVENRLVVAIDRAGHMVGAVRVTEQTLRTDGPARQLIGAEARREIPVVLLRIPAHRSLQQGAIAVAEV